MNEATQTTTQQHNGAPVRTSPRAGGQRTEGGRSQGRRNERSPRRNRRERAPRQRSEFDNKVIDIRRVTRVVAGGRRFSFSVTIVIGNGKGKVGVGLGKASDTALAIEKATRDAQRHLVVVPITDEQSIPHEITAKYASAQILLMPAPGKGLKAGSAVRTVLEFAGVRNVSAKILSRSKNPLNNARATTLALSQLKQVRRARKSDDKKASKKADTKQDK